MKKSLLFIGLTAIVISFSNCKKVDPDPDPIPEVKPGLVINEVLPVNTITNTDQNGEYDDWIELYNNADTAINIKGYFLTDSKTELTKWVFPDTTIAPKGYLNIWCDSDLFQNGYHADFKLSSTGETVILLKPDTTILDKVKYPEQPIVIGEPLEEKSYARIPNGTGDFIWEVPTFLSENISRQ